MADVRLVIGEDNSATVEISFTPTEASAIIAEAARASSVETPPAGSTPPSPPTATTTESPATATEPAPEQPTGPDTLTPEGTPQESVAALSEPGSSGAVSEPATPPPPAPTG